MKILELSYKNILSYGNRLQTLRFDDEPKLILVEGENGAGKCLSKDTFIEVKIDDSILQDSFIDFIKKRNSFLPKPLSPSNK